MRFISAVLGQQRQKNSAMAILGAMNKKFFHLNRHLVSSSGLVHVYHPSSGKLI